MTTALTVFFAVMGIAAGAALAYLLVQDARERSTERPFLPGGPVSAGGPYDFDFDAPELPPCGMRFVLTEEQVEQSFAEIEKNFAVKPRENR